MNSLNFSQLPFGSLVAERQFLMHSKTLFVTISPNPHVKVECIARNSQGKFRNLKRPYGTIPQDLQYKYCIKMFYEDYNEWLGDDPEIIGIAELNEHGNIHLHILINSKIIQNNTQLQIFRRDVLNGKWTQKHLFKKTAKDWMNNIVFLTKSKDEIIEYFMKQQDEMRTRFNNYYL